VNWPHEQVQKRTSKPTQQLFSALNIARMYCLPMSAIVAYLLERIEPSPLDLE
jgi:hypothetical protein